MIPWSHVVFSVKGYMLCPKTGCANNLNKISWNSAFLSHFMAAVIVAFAKQDKC